MERSIVTVNTATIKDELKYNGQTVLTYRIDYPVFQSNYYQMSFSIINKYYKTKALAYQKYLENELYKLAVEQYMEAIENNYPVQVFEALEVFQVTYNKACILSLYFDKYEYTGGAHGNTVRTSDTWNLQMGGRIKLRQLFRCPVDYKTYILGQVTEQIKENPSIYFEDYSKLIVETFNENSFYCTPQGVVIYYQQYDIAPYSSGIREFLIPYNDCVMDPQKMCFSI